MDLNYAETYARRGLGEEALHGLSVFGDLLLNAGFNVTSVRDPESIERIHFLDCLSLLDISAVRSAHDLADIGSGAGLPALVLALVLPGATITAVESVRKKCVFIGEAAAAMNIHNIEVRCARAEEYARQGGRGAHDVVVSRALASLPVVAEYSLPLLRPGGLMVSMKGEISIQERIHGQKALDILGGGKLESTRLDPFPGAENRWVHVARKVKDTPAAYPRRPGVPSSRPLG